MAFERGDVHRASRTARVLRFLVPFFLSVLVFGVPISCSIADCLDAGDCPAGTTCTHLVGIGLQNAFSALFVSGLVGVCLGLLSLFLFRRRDGRAEPEAS